MARDTISILDGSTFIVSDLTSNIGHLLWSGIVDDDKAVACVRHLMSDALFSGWGVRTMASTEGASNPWPGAESGRTRCRPVFARRHRPRRAAWDHGVVEDALTRLPTARARENIAKTWSRRSSDVGALRSDRPRLRIRS
jgi:glycogen debranching enzyme